MMMLGDGGLRCYLVEEEAWWLYGGGDYSPVERSGLWYFLVGCSQ